ncbi:hypothetical protein MD484_g2977, partial [Candolleomyces efflorescens]
MSSSTNNMSNDVHRSNPIPIGGPRGRSRSVSVSSASSASTSSDLPTPPSSSVGGRISIPSPSHSPILSYFLAQSPAKSTSATFPLRNAFGPPPVYEADEDAEREPPVAAHARRASITVAERFSAQSQSKQIPESMNDRGTNLLRRLSLSSSTFTKLETLQQSKPPSPPPNTAVNPTPRGAPFVNRPRRSATINSDGPKPRRAPSPMGERILKGHFDGFN